MDRRAFRDLLANRILVMDGAMGTELMRSGLTIGQCLELANREQPEMVRQIHERYIGAGADIISTNTFGANRFRLGSHGLADQVKDLVHRGVTLARQAAAGRALVALSVGPTGLRLGIDEEITFASLVEGFRQQIEAGVCAGADLISLETMMDISELKAAVVAARQVCDLPIAAQLTFDGELRTLSGTPAVTAAAVLCGLDVDLIGANCSEGPTHLVAVLERMSVVSSLPLIVQPNAGLPKPGEVGALAYPVTPEMMAEAVDGFAALGVRIMGSCCGSSPDYTRLIAATSRSIGPLPAIPNCGDGFLASRTSLLTVGHQAPPILISERFSAFYRSDLRRALIQGERLPIMDEAVEQRSAGAQGINIGVFAPGVEERPAMELAIATVQQTVSLPLAIQSSDPEVMEHALQTVSGRPLLNAVDATEEGMAHLLPLARRYGAMVIVLPQDEAGVSRDLQRTLGSVRRVLARALQLGLRPQDLVIDCLAHTAAGGVHDLEQTLQLSRLVHSELGLYTLFGVSGVSVGRKQRSSLNSAYAAMAIHAGADILIANPLQRDVQSSVLAATELMGRGQLRSP